MRIEAVTDVGPVRKINEDSYDIYQCDDYVYAVVADGMGGHLAGEVASAMAVECIREYITSYMAPELDRFQAKEILCRAFRYANGKIYEYSCQNERVMGMGTTATLCMIRGGYFMYAHVGDSRAYMIDEDIEQITRDHSYVQELVKLGMITPEEAKHHPHRNQITRAMGVEQNVRVDSGIQTYIGQTILLCSDGLFGELEDSEICDIVKNNGAKTAADKLTALALKRGGKDNITAIVMEGAKTGRFGLKGDKS